MPKKPTDNKKLATRIKKKEFYAKVLDEAEKLDFQTACSIEGMDEEIGLLRLKIRSIAGKKKEDIQLLMAATGMLTKMVRTRYNMTKNQKKGLKEAIGTVLKDYAIPLGAAILNKKL